MSDHPDTPDDELQEQAMLYALGAMEVAQLATFEQWLVDPRSRASTLVAKYNELVATVTVATLPACPPPPPEVKARILAGIHASAVSAPAQAAPPFFLTHDQQKWTPAPYKGVRICQLSSASPEFAVVMIELDPATTFPPHDHHGSEDVYILSGNARIEGRLLQAGDFMHSDAGTHHEEMISPGGCRAILVTSRKNYSPFMARAYGNVRRVVSKVGALFGAKDSH